jgi:hypothetical protein
MEIVNNLEKAKVKLEKVMDLVMDLVMEKKYLGYNEMNLDFLEMVKLVKKVKEIYLKEIY